MGTLGLEEADMKRVLIAIDGTPESNDAARFAHGLFGSDVDYLVLTVADAGAMLGTALPLADPMLAGGGAYVDPEVARETVEHAIDEAKERASETAHEVDDRAETIVETGAPGDVIVRVAEERSVDLIVIGSHDRGWFSRLLTPSVRNHVLDHAPCPVLVVR
jgi:nucleotide-binding universal stress UspA family protein